MFHFHIELLTQFAMRYIPSTLDWPARAVTLLSTGDSFPAAVQELLSQARAFYDYETLVSQGHAAVTMVFADVSWKENYMLRLLFHVSTDEENTGDGTFADTVYVAEAMTYRATDEKMPEDCHQNIRDEQRGRRHRHIPLSTIYRAQRQSGVLEAREMGGR